MMKKLFIAFFILAFGYQTSNAQCDAESLVNECIPKLAQGFNYLKSYKLDGMQGNRSTIEYSYVFTKGTQYMINLCSGGSADDIVVDLYDSQRNKVASSMVNGKTASAISFPCKATGIYYLSYSFKESNTYCGGSSLGFRR